MMTPHSKAVDLFNKYYSYLKANLMNDKEAWEDAKVCALIAVDEMLEEISKWAGGEFQEWEKERWKYLQEVKQEIELL
jgi:hypothetical protein